MKDGLKLLNDFYGLIEKVKKFVRKLRKSRVLSNRLNELQAILSLPEVTLIKVIFPK